MNDLKVYMQSVNWRAKYRNVFM